MSKASEVAKEYGHCKMLEGGEWCSHCWQRKGDASAHHEAGARAYFEWLKTQALYDSEWNSEILHLSQIEEYFEQPKTDEKLPDGLDLEEKKEWKSETK